jgi:hypothetical protein
MISGANVTSAHDPNGITQTAATPMGMITFHRMSCQTDGSSCKVTTASISVMMPTVATGPKI